jgi:mannose-6-phosphate isomerase-like protein (cupin superfamily)
MVHSAMEHLMRKVLVAGMVLLVGVPAVRLAAQRRGAASERRGAVTFAIAVTDAAGARLSDVKVSISGPTQRTARTEGGRIVFENLPAGEYRFRFERAGFVALERDVTGRGSAPIPVNVKLSPVPVPPTPIAPVPPLKERPVEGRFVVLDMPAFIEKNYVGRAGGKSTPLSCGEGGTATLLQINEPIAQHTHADADEFIYVIAGQGTAHIGQRQESLGAGVFMMIPRGAAHLITAGPKRPLVFISTRAGEKCAG